jgi:RNA polymerase sigma-70 factor (ECF subfamily)
MAERFAFACDKTAFDRVESQAAIEALERLDTSDRELVVMRIWGGLKFDEIALAMGISTSSAHRQYERALGKLRQILEPPCSTNANRQNLG